MTAKLECLSLPLLLMHPALGRGTTEVRNGLAVSFGSEGQGAWGEVLSELSACCSETSFPNVWVL